MLAIVEIAGTQFEVSKNDVLTVPALQGEPGDTVAFDNILLTKNGEDTVIGTPYLEGNVQAKIIEHGRGDKVLVFHKKRRKGYRKLNGHKQHFTTIEITDITIS